MNSLINKYRRRYTFFGHIDVQLQDNADTSESTSISSAEVLITDYFSFKKTRFYLPIIGPFASTDHVVFLCCLDVLLIYAYDLQYERLSEIRPSSGIGKGLLTTEWCWTQLDDEKVHVQFEGLEGDPCNDQFSHWDSYRYGRKLPINDGTEYEGINFCKTQDAEISSSVHLTCTTFAAFIAINDLTESVSYFRRIFESRDLARDESPNFKMDFHVKKICSGNDHVIILDNNGNVYTWGTGIRGALGHSNLDPQSGEPKLVEMFAEAEAQVENIGAGDWHSIALTTAGDVYGWGWNSHGQLDADSTGEIHSTPYPFDLPTDVIGIYCTGNVTILRADNGKTYSFGDPGNSTK